MDKLISETRTILRAINGNPDIRIKALTNIVKKEIIVTLSEVRSYAKELSDKGLVSTSRKGCYAATQIGIELITAHQNVKPITRENSNHLVNKERKEVKMKTLTPDLKKSLASLREKLETKPIQKVENFETKIQLLNELKSLPGVDAALSGLLSDVSTDLANIQEAASK